MMVAAALLACARAAAPQARSASTGPGSFTGKTALVTGAASGEVV